MEMVEGQNQPKNATKRIKLEEIKAEEEEGGEDRISALPDSLLVEIVSRLNSTKEAIRTGTLSNRWKHIWNLVPVLIFTESDYKWPWSNFASSVDKTLTQCREFKLKKFVLTTGGYGTQSQINSWIRYAIRSNVEVLNLRLWNMENGDEITLDQFFFINSSFTDLKLEGCMLKPSGAISWKNLRSLWISEGDLDEDLIENIFSGSPLLETLILHCLRGFSRLDITSKSLKKLVLTGYPGLNYWDYERRDDVEINAPYILSLTIKGALELSKLLLLNVSSLVEADLDYINLCHWRRTCREEILKRFLLNLSHVKELKIGSSCSKDLFRLEAKGFVVPSNVKFPSVAYNWSEGEGEGEGVESRD